MPGKTNDPSDEFDVDIEGLTDEQKAAVKALAVKVAEDRLKPIKVKLDNAFSDRDKALADAKKLKDDAAAKEAQRLQDEGKELEAAKLRLKAMEDAAEEARQAAAVAAQRLTLVERDGNVTAELANYKFRDAKALNLAKKSVIESLVKQDDGSWKGSDGKSIVDVIKAFCEEHAFLLEPKNSSGSGNSGWSGNNKPGGKPLGELSQAEMLAGIASGSIRRNRNR